MEYIKIKNFEGLWFMDYVESKWYNELIWKSKEDIEKDYGKIVDVRFPKIEPIKIKKDEYNEARTIDLTEGYEEVFNKNSKLAKDNDNEFAGFWTKIVGLTIWTETNVLYAEINENGNTYFIALPRNPPK